ncbi:MAG: hypothetical protein CME31_10610 [Gimesia sp.]|jgi:hypothetical protein|uniref:Uncharacterized protein n=1 Tax=Gimesia maris TaxID=122 RepID=A0A3D3R3X5_9PLAN|nr:hypothetical protein [Gimesia sp.]HCO23286.1 hypothetical protein [Gimesia maris]|tara:strand:- start:31056 stop:31448 length:393 start_codon:yes stop_codon:yes gene_type:complete
MQTNLTRKRFFEIDLPVVLRTAKVFFSRPETQLRLVIYAQCLFTVILFCLVHIGFRTLIPFLQAHQAIDYWVQFLSLVPVISVCFGVVFLLLFGTHQYPMGESWLCIIVYAANFVASMTFLHALRFADLL